MFLVTLFFKIIAVFYVPPLVVLWLGVSKLARRLDGKGAIVFVWALAVAGLSVLTVYLWTAFVLWTSTGTFGILHDYGGKSIFGIGSMLVAPIALGRFLYCYRTKAS